MSKTFLALFRSKNRTASFGYLFRCAVRGHLIANYGMEVFNWIFSKGQKRVLKGSEEWMPNFFPIEKIPLVMTREAKKHQPIPLQSRNIQHKVIGTKDHCVNCQH